MGEFKAGIWLIGLIIYFSVFIITLALTQNFASEMSLDYSVTASGDESLLGNINAFGQVESCSQERKSYNQKSGEYESIGYFFSYSNQCKYSSGALSEVVCNTYDGCTWVNDTIFFFFETGDQSCDGNVNLTSFGVVNWTTADLSGTIIDTSTGDTRFCTFFTNESVCQSFGCTWVVTDYDTDSVSTGTIWGLIGGLFTFNATFTDNVWLDYILTVFLFYLPLIALLIVIYFMIPFFH